MRVDVDGPLTDIRVRRALNIAVNKQDIISAYYKGNAALFAYPDSLTEATTEEDEVGRVVNDFVDLRQPIVDAVGLELPFSPVCRTDCPGLCPKCGVALATAEPDHHHDDIDPRWAKLATMLGSDQDGAADE